MKRVLSGIQPSGQLHLGNYAGAIRQFVDMQQDHEMFIFVASYHALTSVRDPQQLRDNIRQVVIDYIAFGLNPERPHVNLYVQHDVPQVTELAWLLGCVCPKHMMDKATSYKDKVARGLAPNIGLYTYPVLQAADILAVDPDLVPVGEDQRQHVEITRDLAEAFNRAFASAGPSEPGTSKAGTGDQSQSPAALQGVPGVFKLPELMVREHAGVLPGIDGQKMSKSYDNTIDPFMAEKPLRKRIMKIKTDSTPLEDAKDPETCPVFQIFRAIAGHESADTADLAKQYRAGGMGYGQAKQALFELIMDHFGAARQLRQRLIDDPGHIDAVLEKGSNAARAEIEKVLARTRKAVGLD